MQGGEGKKKKKRGEGIPRARCSKITFPSISSLCTSSATSKGGEKDRWKGEKKRKGRAEVYLYTHHPFIATGDGVAGGGKRPWKGGEKEGRKESPLRFLSSSSSPNLSFEGARKGGRGSEKKGEISTGEGERGKERVPR